MEPKNMKECDKRYYCQLLRLYSSGDRQTKWNMKHRRNGTDGST